jgi:hypothetical protein
MGAAPRIPRWQQILRAMEVVLTSLILLAVVPQLIQADDHLWLMVFPALWFAGFAAALWQSRGQFREASSDHPMIARSHRGIALATTWLLIMTVFLMFLVLSGSSRLLIGFTAVALLFAVGAVAEAGSAVPRNDRGQQVPDTPTEGLTAP